MTTLSFILKFQTFLELDSQLVNIQFSCMEKSSLGEELVTRGQEDEDQIFFLFVNYTFRSIKHEKTDPKSSTNVTYWLAFPLSGPEIQTHFLSIISPQVPSSLLTHYLCIQTVVPLSSSTGSINQLIITVAMALTTYPVLPPTLWPPFHLLPLYFPQGKREEGTWKGGRAKRGGKVDSYTKTKFFRMTG